MNKKFEIELVPSGTYKLCVIDFQVKTGMSGFPYAIGNFRIINKCKNTGKIIELGFSLSPKCRYIVITLLRALGIEPNSIKGALEYDESELQSLLDGCGGKIIKCGIGIGIHPKGHRQNVIRPPDNIQVAVVTSDDVMEKVLEDTGDTELKEKPGKVAGETDIDNISWDEI